MIPLYSRNAVYRLDRQAMTLDAQPSEQLMARAAGAAWNALTGRWPEARDLLVLAGPGNNGGDAFALAAMALGSRFGVRLLTLGDADRQSAAAAGFRQSFEQAGGVVEPWDGQALPAAEVIVDGLLGIGLDQPLRAQWLALIDAVNDHPAPVLSIDIPSGLDAETGRPLPRAIRAATTVTYIARKTGQYLADGPDYCGRLLFDGLGLSRAAQATEPPALQRVEAADLAWPPPRRHNTHKYEQGSLLVIGGDRAMTGAAILAGRAALRAGAGVVRLCVHPDGIGSQLAAAPELMCCSWDELEQHLPRASHLIVGPGLGRGEAATALLQRLQTVDKPMLIDADALQPAFIDRLQGSQYVLTPHAGEAARLLRQETGEIQQDRLAALRQLSGRPGTTVLLKGQDSLIGRVDEIPRLCAEGHPGMATAGMGDVLSGMVAALWSQGLDPLEAATTAAFWQGRAARLARWQAGVTAGDVIDALGAAAAGLQP
jgi:NAD(P)H-hydrate epimerase